MKTILTNCTVIDCTGRPAMKDVTVVIEGDRIAGLQPEAYGQAAGEGEVHVMDLKGCYVLPGLWNCHTHLGAAALVPDMKHLRATESVVECAIRAGRNAVEALRFGTTGIRVVGERDFIDVYWKRAFDAGVFVGPHLFACGRAIGPRSVDGPDEMRKLVRENLKHGVDWIKLALGGTVPLLLDEVKAATEVAHEKGVRVCAHARNPGVKRAIRGGVDCIEHGIYMDDEAVQMMVEHDVFYVPTIQTTEESVMFDAQGMLSSPDNVSTTQIAQESVMRESGTGAFQDLEAGEISRAIEGRLLVAKAESGVPLPGQGKVQLGMPLGGALGLAKGHREAFQRALKAGVKIACGGDSSPIGEFTLIEMEHMVRVGMTEMEALIAATRTSADLCGVGDQLGTVEEGKLADLIVLSADPLEDISNIRKLKHVFKGGKLVETKEPEGLGDFWDLFFFG